MVSILHNDQRPSSRVILMLVALLCSAWFNSVLLACACKVQALGNVSRRAHQEQCWCSERRAPRRYGCEQFLCLATLQLRYIQSAEISDILKQGKALLVTGNDAVVLPQHR